MADTDVNVPGTGRVETNINRPSNLCLPYLLSLLLCFLRCFFALSKRKSHEIRSLSLELSE